MEKAGIPELERKLLKALHWNQYAVVKTKNGSSRRICIRRGIRQGSIISPILFNLYTEFMMKELDEEATGIIIEEVCMGMGKTGIPWEWESDQRWDGNGN